MLNIRKICLRLRLPLWTWATIATHDQSTAISSNSDNPDKLNITQFESDESLLSEISAFADDALAGKRSITARQAMKSYNGSSESDEIETELAQAHAGLLDTSEYLTVNG